MIVTAPSGATVDGVEDPSSPSAGDPWSTYTIAETGVHQILVVPRSMTDAGLITLEIDALS